MVKELDDIAIQELKETFDLFDKDKDGYLQLAEFRKVMRCTGINPSEADFKKMIELAKIESKISFKQFLEVVKEDTVKKDTEEQLVGYFQVFDANNSGTVPLTVLKDCLKAMGEPLNDREFVEFTKLLKPNTQGEVDYRTYVSMLFRSRI